MVINYLPTGMIFQAYVFGNEAATDGTKPNRALSSGPRADRQKWTCGATGG